MKIEVRYLYLSMRQSVKKNEERNKKEVYYLFTLFTLYFLVKQ